MKKLTILVLALCGCYAEWDVPRMPRKDPCTGITDVQVVYVQPTCPNPPRRNPRDNDR